MPIAIVAFLIAGIANVVSVTVWRIRIWVLIPKIIIRIAVTRAKIKHYLSPHKSFTLIELQQSKQ